MICSSCGKKNEAGSKFCFVCGTKLEPAPIQPIQKAKEIKGREYYPSTAPISIEEEAVVVKEDLSTRPLVLASLVLEEGNKEFQLPFLPQVLIGRLDKSGGILPELDLTELDKNKVTSRKHAAIIYSDGKYYLKDLGSMNGTFINDKRLQSNVEYPIKNEDKIMLGKLVFAFKCNN
jgi:hypothetical protein